jgi:hypothetical protein
VAQFVEALGNKPENRWFDYRCCNQNFSLNDHSGRTMALMLTEPLIETSTRCILAGQRRPVRMADFFTTFIC